MAEIQQTDGGIAAYRCFRTKTVSRGRVALTAIAGDYEWQPGPQAAKCQRDTMHRAEPMDEPGWDWDTGNPSRVPVFDCGCGFWGYKSYRQLLRGHGAGGGSDYVLGLIEQWGKIVPAEIGARSEFAEVTAIIEPIRPESEFFKGFPKEGLLTNYPDVPIVSLSEVSGIVKDRGLTLLKLEPPPPLFQWIDSSGHLVWKGDRSGADYGRTTRLPVAAAHPDEALPEYRLIKARFRYDDERVYAYWRRDNGNPESKQEDRSRFLRALQDRPASFDDIHLEEI